LAWVCWLAMATASVAVPQELVNNECLQHVMRIVTAHLEPFVEHRVSEAHDALANRIEDVVAAHVGRLRAEVLLSATRSHSRCKSSCTSGVGKPENSVLLRKAPTAEQRQRDDLEVTVARVAATTARDMAALRTEIASELRGVGSSVHAALEQAMAELASMKEVLAEIQRTTPDLKSPKTYLGWSVETDVTTAGSQRRLESSTPCPSGHAFSSSSIGLVDPDACLSSESEGFATPPGNKAAFKQLSPDFFLHGRDGRHRASALRPRSTPPAGNFVRKAVSMLEKTPGSSDLH